MKSFLKMAALAAVCLSVTPVSTSFAGQPVPPPGNSAPGLDRYLSNPGRQQATEVGAQNGSGAGSGAFGYFGKDNNLKGGADGYATGLNNSGVAGNRQGNLP
jgi:hypothetical protein